jgi:hypothetical protein
MYFDTKSYLKNNRNHTIKQTLTGRKKTNLNSKHLTSMQQVNVLSSD